MEILYSPLGRNGAGTGCPPCIATENLNAHSWYFNLEMVSAELLKHLGFVCYVYHSRTQSWRVPACNVTQQSAPVSHFHRAAVTLRIKVKFLADVVSSTRVWMCVSSRVVQSTLPA